MQRLCHSLAVEGLQQIIHRVHFERLDRILIEGGREDDLGQRNFLVEQFLDNAEAVEAWHLHVQKNQIRTVLADQIDRFHSIFALGYDLHIADVLQQISEFISGQLLIIDDHGR